MTAAGIALLAVGCADTAPSSGDPASGGADLETLPAERDGILVLEGSAEPVRLSLFESGESFRTPFHTYLPAGIMPSRTSEEEIQWAAAFDGEPDVRARVVLSLLPPDASREETLALLDQEAQLRGGTRAEEARRYPWARHEWWIGGPGTSGTLLLDWRQNQPFLLEIVHPEELEEGFLPRVAWLLEEWRWAPEGEPLIPPPPDPATSPG